MCIDGAQNELTHLKLENFCYSCVTLLSDGNEFECVTV